ncbi:uncharacterized protein [Diadema antillarum]|uniref:uncharacterized protein n=1 Tax=Diadema antillarum TaxID=105358 RepID=UPI003A850D50
MELLSSFDSSDQNKEGWNSGTSAILLLLCLLPPASQGRSKAASAKVSISSAISRIIQFQKSGGSIQDFLDGTKQTQSQPFLLGIGNSKACISSYLLIVDHKAIPCGACTVEGAVDELFKTHFVFGLHYCQSLHQFWTFTQTAVFEIDVGVSRESPRVPELKGCLERTAFPIDTTVFTTTVDTGSVIEKIKLLPWIVAACGAVLVIVTTLLCCACRRRKRKPYYLRRLRLSKRKSGTFAGAADDAGHLVVEKGVNETSEKTERAPSDSSGKHLLSGRRDRIKSMDQDDWVEDVSFDGNWIDKDNSSASDTYL